MLTKADLSAARELLGRADLLMPEAPDYGVGYFEGDALAAVGFRKGPVIMGICVAPEHRGGELASRLMSHLLSQANASGLKHLFLFTKPSQVASFSRLGFGLVALAPEHAALLEFGWPDFAAWLEGAAPYVPSAPEGEDLGAIVVNANPFTLGHRYLVEQAAAACGALAVFVVEEDASAFPFDARLRLVREGTAHIPGCVVLPGGPYMVTRSTFPSYFTGATRHAAAHAMLDATLFATRIAPALGVARRFVGTEPFSAVTRVYNEALAAILPPAGVRLTVLERMELHGGPVSASRVRALLACGDVEAACALVPETTAAWLTGPDAAPVLAALARDGAGEGA